MANKRITLSPEVMLEIEEALNYPCFFGSPVGATINEALIIAHAYDKWVLSWRSRIAHYLKVAYYLRSRYQRFLQRSFRPMDFSCYADRIVFTWLFDRSDLKAFVLPLVENYGFDNSIVVGPLVSMQSQWPDQTTFISWDEFPAIDMNAWKREFVHCAPTWRHRLSQVLEKHSVPLYVADFLMRHLQIQTRRIMAAHRFLDVISPKAIVTEYDRSGRSSCLALAAKQRGIPVITMVHGAALRSYPSYGYAPILSDYVCCWGNQHKNKLIEHGVNQEHLVITGCQALSRTLEAKKNLVLLKAGLPVDKPVVLLATSAIKLEDRKHYAWIFCDAMSRLPEMTAIVRLHPGENITEYQEIVEKFPMIAFLSNAAMSKEESLTAADIVIIHETSFGIEALLMGKLVIILDVLAIPLTIGKELIEMAGCPGVKSSDELELVIRKIFSSDNSRKELYAKAEQYALQFCVSYGQDAVNNVCQVIDHAIESRDHNNTAVARMVSSAHPQKR